LIFVFSLGVCFNLGGVLIFVISLGVCFLYVLNQSGSMGTAIYRGELAKIFTPS